MSSDPSEIRIEEILDHRGRKRFVRFQFDLYADDPLWVPPLIRDEVLALDAEKNPGLEDCELRLWLAVRGTRPVGRIAAVVNHRDNAHRGVRAARFALLEFIDDREVSRQLLATAQRWARERGMEKLEGPLGLTTFERSAVLVDGFDRLPTAVSSYNPPYYGEHIEACGFGKEVDYVEHRFRVPGELDPKYGRVADYVLKKKGLQVLARHSRRTLLRYGREVFHLINAAYSDLFEFTPMSDREIDALIKKFFSFIDPEFVKLIADKNGEIVAVGAAMPSVSRALQAVGGKLWPFGFVRFLRAMRRNDTLDLYLVAVRPELRNAGLTAVLMHEMHKQALAAGLEWVETNGELETNTRVLAMWKDVEHETHKRRRIYVRDL